MRLGLHLDIRGGHLAALRRAEALGCRAMQVLAYRRRPARGTGAEPGVATGVSTRWEDPAARELNEFRAAREAGPVESLIVHARYLPYLSAEDPQRRARSRALLVRELRLADALGGGCLVVHLGAWSYGSERRRGLELFAEAAAAACAEAAPTARLVIENVPGGGRRLGGSLEELAEALELLARRGARAQICLDTAHAWAHGYELDTREGMWRFLARAHRLFDAANVPVFHLNDSRARHGSRREHHWHWGRGLLGSEGLAALLERPEYAGAAGILETPPGPGEDEANLRFVRALLPR